MTRSRGEALLQTLIRGRQGGEVVDSRGHLEEAGHEGGLRLHVVMVDVVNLPFPDHRHHLIARRMPSVIKVLQVKKLPIRRLKFDLEALPPLPGPARARILGRSTPSMVGSCNFIKGGSAAEKTAGLLEVLRAEGALP